MQPRQPLPLLYWSCSACCLSQLLAAPPPCPRLRRHRDAHRGPGPAAALLVSGACSAPAAVCNRCLLLCLACVQMVPLNWFAVRLSNSYQHHCHCSPAAFFFCLLPPIVYQAGFSLKKRQVRGLPLTCCERRPVVYHAVRRAAAVAATCSPPQRCPPNSPPGLSCSSLPMPGPSWCMR